jgi:AraC family transcriptional activator of pobA
MVRKRKIIILQLNRQTDMTSFYKGAYFIHILCDKGMASFKINNISYELGKDDVLTCLPSITIEDLKFSEDFNATGLFMSWDIFNKSSPDISLGVKASILCKHNPVIHLDSDRAKAYSSNFDILEEKYNNNDGYAFQDKLIEAQVHVFTLEMWKLFTLHIQDRKIYKKKGAHFEQFKLLAQEHCMEHRKLKFYADKLSVSTIHLSMVCAENGPKFAKELIEYYTAKHLAVFLENPNIDIKEIALHFKFCNAAHLTTFVKRLFGTTPLKYRQQLYANVQSPGKC